MSKKNKIGKKSQPAVMTDSDVRKAEIKPVSAPAWKGIDKWDIINMLLVLVAFLSVYTGAFTDKLDLNGDNIFYYALGKALASGAGYVDVIYPVANPHNHFPPGYPFLTSLFMRLGFEEITFYYKLNGVLAYSMIVILYALMRRIGADRRLALVVCLFTALNPAVLGFALTNMSEVPYLFFSIGALYLLTKIDFEVPFYRSGHFWLLLACLVMSYYIRTAGIALVVAAAGMMLLRKKWLYLLATMGGFILSVLPWYIRTKELGGNAYMKQFASRNPYAPELGEAGFSDYIERITTNLSRYISREIPDSLLSAPGLNMGVAPSSSDWITGLLIVGLVMYALIHVWKTQPATVIYIVASGGILLLWPAVWTGVRFIVPVVPLLIMFSLYGIHLAFSNITQKMKISWNPLILCIGLLLMNTPIQQLKASSEEAYPPNFQNYFDVATWAKENLPDSSIVCCRKPELFYIFSGLRATNYDYTFNDTAQLKFLEEKGVDYVVIDQLGFSSTGKYLVPAVQKNMDRFEVIYQKSNPDTYLLRFKHK